MRTAILMGCLLLAKTQPGFSQAKDLALGFAIIATIAMIMDIAEFVKRMTKNQ